MSTRNSKEHDLSGADEGRDTPISQLEGESEDARIERLGRQRPEKLKSLWIEIAFVFSITVGQALAEYFVSGFTILVPTVTKALDIPPSATTWPASAFSLVVSAFLLPFGRVADIYGGYPVYMAGITWFAVLSLALGFAQNEITLDVLRALQGLGPAAYLPAALQILGNTYRPGPRKSLVFFIYGGMGVMGFFVGFLFAGIAGEFLTWRWYFWIGSILVAIVAVASYIAIPSDVEEHKNNGVKMDWLGSCTTISGLILVIYAITDSSHATQGWATPRILVTFILGIGMLAVAFYVEGWIAEQPLLPFEVFKIKGMRPFILGLLFCYGPLGIFLLYTTLLSLNVWGISPMQLVAWYTPVVIVGLILAIGGGMTLHLIPAKVLMAVTGLAIILESVLLALAPAEVNYWKWVFIPMLCSTVAFDVIFSVANIFFSTSLPAHQQGLAGSLGNALVQLGIALLLGFAEVIASQTAYQGQQQSYRNVFWFNMACGAMALVLFSFVSIGRANSDLTADEKAAVKAATEDDVLQSSRASTSEN
ncbi:related to transporter (major facilitator superfamily) [Ramularia collo-cygni]|uniref:Related to transporter (Major facilitator superfamily) n=1 Tax=Ramularia collo-cygni TaxID=112498 RepID=A0A2D3V8Z3_9PEZI|nr:related to transporter (major facilitator superfamily) [Ramularia collo-cygni]CZT24483.1 related to transporter (major facilitator superfamily) [Ramularia collo-cygni]